MTKRRERVAYVIFYIVCALALVTSLYAQETLAKPQQDKLVEAPKALDPLATANLKLLVTQRQLVQERASRLQLEYDKAQRDLQEQFTKLAVSIEAEMKKSYDDAKISPAEYDIDVEKGIFVKRQAPTPPVK